MHPTGSTNAPHGRRSRGLEKKQAPVELSLKWRISTSNIDAYCPPRHVLHEAHRTALTMPYFKIILIFAILVVAALLPIPKWNEQPQPPTPKQEEQPQPDCSMKIILSMVDESVLYCDRRRANCRKENIHAVLGDQGSQDPFNIFARDAETAVIDATQKALCTHDTATLPVVELHFIKLGLIGNESRKAQFYSLMSPIKGSYADIQIDNERNRIAATIIWNPVVMLRDQMSVERHDLGKRNPYIQAYFGGHPSPIDEKKLKILYECIRRDRHLGQKPGRKRCGESQISENCSSIHLHAHRKERGKDTGSHARFSSGVESRQISRSGDPPNRGRTDLRIPLRLFRNGKGCDQTTA